MRELETDNLLLKYSIVIIDEAHERTINNDIIIGFLSEIIKIRYLLSKYKKLYKGQIVKPLRLVIMSATIQVDEFLNSSIFTPKPAFIKVEARQFSVTVHHTKKTPINYLNEAFNTVKKIHKRLPVGAILVFLTGRQEIIQLIKMLSDEILNNKEENIKVEKESDVVIKGDDEDAEVINKIAKDIVELENEIDNISDDNENKDKLLKQTKYKNAIILPLYSSLTNDQQMKVFESVPTDTRLIVIATNVAETSLTIPNVRYVVDCGKAKKRVYI